MLQIRIDARAQKFIHRRSEKHARQIIERIDLLATAPFAPDVKRVKVFPFHRADVGEYRILYRVETGMLHVYLVGKRNDDEVYKQLKRLGG